MAMPDEEIIKALERCIKWKDGEDCVGCPAKDKGECCFTTLRKASLDLINRKDAEIERLKEPKCVNIVHARSMGKTHSLYRAIYTEAIKEFAEELKNCFCVSKEYLDIMNIIDNLVKEMVGD